MKKITYNTLMLCLPLLSVVPVQAQENELSLTHYCSLDDINIEQGVSVGEVKTVRTGEGAFYLIESSSRYQPTRQHLRQALSGMGLSEECKEFLLLGSKFEAYEKSDLAGRVYFEFDKSRLTKESVYILDKLLRQIKNAKNPALILEGHTDSIGSEDYNFSLGLRRAASVEQYLVAGGAKTASLESVSKGESTPIASNESAAGRQSNRRVDMIVD